MKDKGIRDKAKKLYFKWNSLIEVAKIIGVSERTVAKWSSEEGWYEQRKEISVINIYIELGLKRLLKSMIEKAIKTLNHEDINLVIQLNMSMGNENNQLYAFRQYIIKNLRDRGKLTFKEIGKKLGITPGEASKNYKKITQGMPGRKPSSDGIGNSETRDSLPV